MTFRFRSIQIAVLLLSAGSAFGAQPRQNTIADNVSGSSVPEARPANTTASALVPTPRYPRYLLRPSDVLQITFPISPEFDQIVTIQPDGFVALRGVGDLFVKGQSVPELITALHRAYGAFLHDPVIDVELKDFEKPYFVAGGELGHPGKYELRGDTTVTEAIAIAGGFTDRSKHSQVLIFRRVPGGWQEATRLDVKQMIASRNLDEDLNLRPGDLIYVPKSTVSKIRSFIPNTGLGFAIP